MSQEISHNQSHNIQEDPKPLDKSAIEDIIAQGIADALPLIINAV